MTPAGGGPPRKCLPLIVVALLVALVAHDGGRATACSMPAGWRPLSPVEKVLNAEVVLFGRVRAVYPDHTYNYGAETTAYTAAVRVFCVLKGDRTERLVNITEAGHVPGFCHSTNLTVGRRYVILASVDDSGTYRPTERQFDATTQRLGELMTACGLQPVYPRGVDGSTARVKCPTPAPPGECRDHDDFTRPPPPPDPYDYYDYDYGGDRRPVARRPTPAAIASKEDDGKRGVASAVTSSSAVHLTAVSLAYFCRR